VIETRDNTHNKPKSETCHCSNPKPGGTCCDLVCFERPNYFCGHLLTDTDLSKEQQYVVEKHKLYNRALHGSGVVCGLRLTCDDQCGGILIDKGFAIDDCGNDLVVCDPIRFDVLARLKEKGYLSVGEPCDPCKPPEDQPDCDYPQCFYVTVCYQEEPGDFTTPFVSGCAPGLTECEPTRIREGVVLDVLDTLPEQSSWLEDLKQRLAGCFCIFTKGAFAQALQTNGDALEVVLSTPNQIGNRQYDNLFYQLRGLFLLFLKKHPDKYNCGLAKDVQYIMLPDPEQQRDNYGQRVSDAFCELFRLIWQYAISCALGELVPRCPGSDHAGCVVLGTVEVRGGCVTHVCNCPRSYVWSFANFWQVLAATLLGGAACEEESDEQPHPRVEEDPAGVLVPHRGDDAVKDAPHGCCAEFDFDCRWLLRLLKVSPRSLNYAGASSIDAFSNLAKSVKQAFNFAQPQTFSPAIFQNMSQGQFEDAAQVLGLKDVAYRSAPLDQAKVHFVDMMYRSGLATPMESTVIAELDDKKMVVNAFALPNDKKTFDVEKARAMRTSAATSAAFDQRTKDLEDRVAAAEEHLRSLTGAAEPKLAEIRKKINEALSQAAEMREREAQEAPKKRSARRRRKPVNPEGEGGNA
jgi:ElaB/YqjD/DUF883 family membrane-anchored ribosome-binding protein